MGPRKTESMSKRPADDSNSGDSNSGERHKARKQEKCRCQALTKMEVATLARAAGTTVKKLTPPETACTSRLRTVQRSTVFSESPPPNMERMRFIFITRWTP